MPLEGMGYRRISEDRWVKPIGFCLLMFGEGRLSLFFPGLNRPTLCWNAINIEWVEDQKENAEQLAIAESRLLNDFTLPERGTPYFFPSIEESIALAMEGANNG